VFVFNFHPEKSYSGYVIAFSFEESFWFKYCIVCEVKSIISSRNILIITSGRKLTMK
jgi:hypothetical protein